MQSVCVVSRIVGGDLPGKNVLVQMSEAKQSSIAREATLLPGRACVSV